MACVHRNGVAYACMLLVHACIPKNPNFDNFDDSISNGHNSLNLSPNYARFVFKLKPRMSTF